MNFEVLNYCEIDEQASRSYSAIHNVPIEKNLGDICGIDLDTLPLGFTLLTHGSPCTSFSNAGLRLGGDRGSGTPSSLMWNSVEIIRHCKPKFVLWENVSTVLSKKHKHNFDEYVEELREIGYESYYKVMNAKKYGCPQNRDRIFVLSIRKDIDKGFIFPEEVELTKTLKDILEKDVDPKFYLTETQINRIKTTTYMSGRRRIQYKDWCDTVCARDWKDPKCVEDEKGVRKLTPKEYWRIQGFKDSDFEVASKSGQSNSSLYKQAGNSISYDVLKALFTEIVNQYDDDFIKDLTYLSLFSGIGAFEMVLRDIVV
jgi:DNA (cytosine-5)-methyltransferase 1